MRHHAEAELPAGLHANEEGVLRMGRQATLPNALFTDVLGNRTEAKLCRTRTIRIRRRYDVLCAELQRCVSKSGRLLI